MSKLPHPREDLIEATRNARQRHARQLYKIEHVQESIQAAASKGAGHLHISQKIPYTLQDTHAAKELLAWAEYNKYSIHWTPKVKKLNAGVYQHYRELVIWWMDYDMSLTAQEATELQEMLQLHMLQNQVAAMPKADGAKIQRYNAGPKSAGELGPRHEQKNKIGPSLEIG